MRRVHVTLGLSLLGLAVGLALSAVDQPGGAAVAWLVGPVAVVGPLARSMIRAARRREPDVDVIALLAIVGAVAVGELFAAAVVSVMLAGGETLEQWAAQRAGQALSALLRQAPRRATVLRDGEVREVAVERVAVGDLVLVQPGQVIGVDGVLETAGTFDESTLTGESVPVRREPGEAVASGATNVGSETRLTATATAADSTYAGIVRLVEQAKASKAPAVRLADRWAGWFVPLALAVSATAWLVSGDPVRGLAVLVVATPCPLLLAVPIAMVSGISRAAANGIIVKHGGALESLAATTTVCLDKTGTLTTGRPVVEDRITVGTMDPGEALRLAAGLEQLSAHPFAPAVVHAARDAGLRLPVPVDVHDEPGAGVSGTVEHHRVRVGSMGYCAGDDGATPPAASLAAQEATRAGASIAFVAVDDVIVLALRFADPLRPESAEVVEALRGEGIEHVVMLTGDHGAVANEIAATAGVHEVVADLSAEQKVAEVEARAARATVTMVGDGVNDAPALAAAAVGVAMGARGATASSETADIVITADRLDGLLGARRIAIGTVRIATQSAAVGMGLSLVAMAAAAAGLLPPAAGALLQEGIDVAAILNALRVLRLAPGRAADDHADGVARGPVADEAPATSGAR